MWRAIFISFGTVLLIFGIEFLIVDKAIWAKAEDAIVQRPQNFGVQGSSSSSSFFTKFREEENTNPNEFEPDEWVPWALLSSGAVIILYSITIPRRAIAAAA